MSFEKQKIILASQECNFSGAAMLAVNIAKKLKEKGYKVIVICNYGGPLYKEIAKYGITFLSSNEEFTSFILRIAKFFGYNKVITNTTMAGHVARLATQQGMQVISLIHELNGIIRAYGVSSRAKDIVKYSSKIIFPNHFVMDNFISKYKLRDSKALLKGQGLYKKFSNGYSDAKVQSIKKSLSISIDCKVVIGVGIGDKRKGLDLFIKAAKKVKENNDKIQFIWVGTVSEYFQRLKRKAKEAGVMLIENTNKVEDYYRIADLFLMTSREDPFPSVVLEAIYCGIPMIGFEGAGGFQELPKEYVELVPLEDVEKMVHCMRDTLQNQERLDFVKENGKKFICDEYDFDRYVGYFLMLFEGKR